ncbi:MAG: helix-turn-helix domain-containing protein [Lachnospiraceae bacterium]
MKSELQTVFTFRQYMISKDFELYYYHDCPFSGVPSHKHNYYEFYLFLEGSLTLYIGDHSFPLKPGDLVIIPPGISHHVISHDENIPYRRFVFWISEDFYHQLTSLSSDYQVIISYAKESQCYVYHNDVVTMNALHSKLFRIIEELHSDHFGRDTKITISIHDFLLHINRLAYEFHHPKKPKKHQDLCQNLMQYIEYHLDENLSLDYLSKVFFVSKYHIAHVFKEDLGLSLHQYILKKRLSMCRDALLSDTKIGDMIFQYGFKDYTSFYRAFKKEFGLSPKEYRESHTAAIRSPLTESL